MDGDGVPDLIVGKRLYSHLESHLDPDPYGPAVLYWYRTVRNPKAEGGAEFVPELIHNRSGVGSQFVVTDLNGDGAPDIVTSCVKGTFVFWNQMQRAARKPRGGRTSLLKCVLKFIASRFLTGSCCVGSFRLSGSPGPEDAPTGASISAVPTARTIRR